MTDHVFLPVAGHPDDDECTHRADGTDATYCGRTRAEHERPVFFIDDDGAFTGSVSLCVTDPEGGLLVVAEKCEMYDHTWEAVVTAVGES
jgi:hypothetical protein